MNTYLACNVNVDNDNVIVLLLQLFIFHRQCHHGPKRVHGFKLTFQLQLE